MQTALATQTHFPFHQVPIFHPDLLEKNTCMQLSEKVRCLSALSTIHQIHCMRLNTYHADKSTGRNVAFSVHKSED